jgi:hypothetical protein
LNLLNWNNSPQLPIIKRFFPFSNILAYFSFSSNCVYFVWKFLLNISFIAFLLTSNLSTRINFCHILLNICCCLSCNLFNFFFLINWIGFLQCLFANSFQTNWKLFYVILSKTLIKLVYKIHSNILLIKKCS